MYTKAELQTLTDIANEYQEYKDHKCTIQDVKNFVEGVSYNNDSKSNQNWFMQGISFWGNKADRTPELRNSDKFKLYESLYDLTTTKKCKYCGKDFKIKLMIGNLNNGACFKSRCSLMSMRDSL
jgi:hypothetical protein